MGDWPVFIGDGQRFEDIGTLTAFTEGTNIAANASANTKGSWVQLIASTAFNSSGIRVYVHQMSSTGADYLMDIGVGAASSEKIIVSNILVGVPANRETGMFVNFPVEIPSGSRVSVRIQSTTGSLTFKVAAILEAGGWLKSRGFGRATTYGATTADSGGISIDPGGSGDTKGSWIEIGAAIANPIKLINFAIGNQINGTRLSARWFVDLGVGAAASEKVVIPNLYISAQSNIDLMIPIFLDTIPVDIPSGSRVSIRAQCNITDATDRLFDIVLYGMD